MAGIQKWEIEPFERFHEYHHRCADLLHMLREAAHFVQARPILIELMRAEWGPQKTEFELAQAERNAKIALAEAEAGHPLLHAQAVVILWGGLEALLLDFLATWLINKPESRTLEPVKNLKIGFGEYEGLPPEDRAAYLLERLEDKLGSRRAGGVERFEALFRLFGMSSEVDERIVRDLLELSAIRNLLVHKRGIVDVRFRNQCPWTVWEVGSQIAVSYDDYRRYFDAVDLYVFEVTQRLLTYHGLPRSGHEPTCRFHVAEEPSKKLPRPAGAWVRVETPAPEPGYGV